MMRTLDGILEHREPTPYINWERVGFHKGFWCGYVFGSLQAVLVFLALAALAR